MQDDSHRNDSGSLNLFWRAVVVLIRLMTVVSCAAVVCMIFITCFDIVLRLCRISVNGAYDIIKICGAISVACAMPLTTAMKGHVAIEYFFHKLNRRYRIIVDSIMRLGMMVGFSITAWACFDYGAAFLKNREVTDTIEIPVFWVPWLMAFAFTVTVLVVLFHLIFPGRELVRQ
jgi:TRAP-type C4-dicarboxylate transport system permease small subunit